MSGIMFSICRNIYSKLGYFPKSYILPRQYCFRSGISLDKLYPGSSLKLTSPDFVAEDPNDNFNGYIPINKLDITYSCASGPGGQNVNKVKTKVDLRFKVKDADWLDASIRERILKECTNQITKEGYLIFKSELTRSQILNQADCMKKLRDFLRKASEPKKTISPETEEMIRQRKEKAARERLRIKRIASEKKSARQISDCDL